MLASATGRRYQTIQRISSTYRDNINSYLGNSVGWPRRASIRVPREVYTRNAEQRRRLGTGINGLSNG